jgi:hypothetical protein
MSTTYRPREVGVAEHPVGQWTENGIQPSWYGQQALADVLYGQANQDYCVVRLVSEYCQRSESTVLHEKTSIYAFLWDSAGPSGKTCIIVRNTSEKVL